MGACLATDHKGDEVESVGNWETSPAANYSYNASPHYGNYQDDFSSSCMICSSGVENIGLGDGRKLCRNCLSSSIMSREELEPIIESILEFFEDKNLMIKKSTPVFLVTKDDIVRICTEGVQQEGAIPVDPSDMSTIPYGLTTRNKWEISNVISCSQRGSSMEVTKHFKRTSGKGSSVLILYGLPRVFTEQVLAHEMMHVWLNSQGLGDKLEMAVEEGLAEVMSKMWLEERYHSFPPHLNHLDLYKSDMEDAYIEAKTAVMNYGLGNVLTYVSRYKMLPS